jgi:hypothetical protein
MAISALSLAHRAGTQSGEALDHYVQVVPAMRRFVRSEQDSNSDGALFTHYLLLLYEVSMTEYMMILMLLSSLASLSSKIHISSGASMIFIQNINTT